MRVTTTKSFLDLMYSRLRQGRAVLREGRPRFLGEFVTNRQHRLIVRADLWSRHHRTVKYYQGVHVDNEWRFGVCTEPRYEDWNPNVPSCLTPLVVAKLIRKKDRHEASKMQ